MVTPAKLGPYLGARAFLYFLEGGRLTMAKEQVQAITKMEEDFAQWYTDIVKKAELVDYSSVKGCMIIRPYGYALWENIQKVIG